MGRGVIIRTVINNFTFDGATTDPMQKAVRDPLIGFMAATAQAQAEATKVSQRAGIEHAKGREDSPYLGRKPATARAVRTARANARASEVAGTIKDIQASGVTTLLGIAAELNRHGIPTATGCGKWCGTRVRRVLARLAG
jgi:putative DNA-invertase from lambdoid prophage Rac